MKKRILLIVSGGIAAVKCPDLIHRLSAMNIATSCILTSSGAEFVTPLSLATFSGDKVYDELFCLTDESQMGHIELSRRADLILIVPATAHILARMASGLADDLATTVLLATDKPVMVAPAMNVQMWEHAATAHNLDTLKQRGIMVIGIRRENGEQLMPPPGDAMIQENDSLFVFGNSDAVNSLLATNV